MTCASYARVIATVGRPYNYIAFGTELWRLLHENALCPNIYIYVWELMRPRLNPITTPVTGTNCTCTCSYLPSLDTTIQRKRKEFLRPQSNADIGRPIVVCQQFLPSAWCINLRVSALIYTSLAGSHLRYDRRGAGRNPKRNEKEHRRWACVVKTR